MMVYDSCSSTAIFDKEDSSVSNAIFQHPTNPRTSSPDSVVFEVAPGYEPMLTVRLWTGADFTHGGRVERCQIEFGAASDRATVSVTLRRSRPERQIRVDRFNPRHFEWQSLRPDHPDVPAIVACAVALVERYFAHLPIFSGRSTPAAFFHPLVAA
jgi:hypothetical protein